MRLPDRSLSQQNTRPARNVTATEPSTTSTCPARLAEALALLREHIFKEQDGVFPEALATLGGADWEAAEAVRSRVGGSLSRPAS